MIRFVSSAVYHLGSLADGAQYPSFVSDLRGRNSI